MIKYVIVIFIFVTLTLMAMFISNSERERPEFGDWICWYTSIESQECGTYGYSKNKKVAQQVGLKECEEACQSKCKLDYCEKPEKPKD